MITRLYITPRPALRITRNVDIYYKIPYADLRPEGKRMHDMLEGYKDYKDRCLTECKRQHFTIPESGGWFRYYLPVAKSWWASKRARHHLTPHITRPDIDNLMKALKDSVLKSDQAIWDYRMSKFYVNEPTGYIDIENDYRMQTPSAPITLDITPETCVRMTREQIRALLNMSDDQLNDSGIRRRDRIIQYFTYKANLLKAAEDKGYQLHQMRSWIQFFLPVSPSWSQKQKQAMHLQPHQFKPDLDNLGKAFIDSMVANDSSLYDIRLTKRWTNTEHGYIKIYNNTILDTLK